MKRTLTILTLLFVIIFAADAQEARLLRFPAVGGETIVFSYAGNLYNVPISGGEARKLTSGDSYDVFPKISPDGKTIAFTGQYDGNTEVYTMPINGGEPKRLTFTAKVNRDNVGDRMGPNNIVLGWTPDGKEILYRSKWYAFSGLRGLVYKVDATGSQPRQLPMTECSWSSYSPDGKQLAFNRMFREFRTWKHYEGGQADEIWINKVGTTEMTKITDNKNQDIFPMWVDDCIYYISDRDFTMNLFCYDTKEGTTKKLTDFKEYDIKFPTASEKYIVFENGGFIYKYDIAKGACDKVTITLTDNNLSSRPMQKTFSSYASSMSPDGERALVMARGEIFSVPSQKGSVYNLTNTPGAHERAAQWSPDGKWIAYFSDKDGEYQLYLLPTGDTEKNSQPSAVTDFKDGYPDNITWSNDSRFLLFTTDKREVYKYDIASSKTSLVASSNEGVIYDLNISPDNQWIAYITMGENNVNRIWIQNLSQTEATPVTPKWYSSYNPKWSEDGKYLFFISNRDYNISYSSVEWNTNFSLRNYMFVLPLEETTSLPTAFKANEFDNRDKAEPTVKDDKKKVKTEEKLNIKIDFENIEERACVLFEHNGGFSISGMYDNKLFFSDNGKNKKLNLSTMESSDAFDGYIIDYSPSTKKVLLSGSRIADINNQSSAKEIPVGNLKMVVDPRAEWIQLFNESWRVFRDGFYVTNMHGVNWQNMYDRYSVMLPYVNHRHDLTYLISEMIGETNVGHAYITSGDAPQAPIVHTGLLGAKFTKDSNGNYRIDYIFDGEDWNKGTKSPMRSPGVNAKIGEYIVAIDGVAANKYVDIYEALVGKVGVTVALDINSLSSNKGARRVYVTPIDDEQGLAYHNWVKRNIEKVDSLSGGLVGYIHIPDMSAEGMKQFTKYFYPQLDKKALLIDDRMNGGGNVSPMILERLQREIYRLSMGRNRRGGTIPAETHYGPKLCLIDKYSMSDGDLFPYGFRQLGLGKLMGTRTWGGIVGITGSRPYLDGQDMRTPFFTSYSTDGNWILENEGVTPDIEIDINPFEDFLGNDAQLNEAVKYLLNEIKKYPDMPVSPAEPVRVINPNKK